MTATISPSALIVTSIVHVAEGGSQIIGVGGITMRVVRPSATMWMLTVLNDGIDYQVFVTRQADWTATVQVFDGGVSFPNSTRPSVANAIAHALNLVAVDFA